MSGGMKMNRSLILAAVTAAHAAVAQTYTVQSTALPYQPLVGGTNMKSLFTSTDDAQIIVPIGFSFPYYGNTYTQVGINSNGFITFDTTYCRPPGTASCLGGTSIPNSSRSPHFFIAPFWEDLSLGSATEVNVLSSASQFDVEWKQVNDLGGLYTITMKITLTSSGLIQVHYGPKTGSSGTGVMGFEGDGLGTNGASFNVPPSNTPCSTTSASCTMANFPSDTLYTVGQPVAPDLVVESVALNSVMTSGGMMTLSVSPTFRNFGQNPANTFTWEAYLSTNRTYEAGDTLIGTSSTPLTVAGGTTGMGTLVGTIPQPPNGNYYVVVRADTTNVVAEGTFGETNNVGATSNYFVSGLDLVATSVTGPAMTGPGNMMTVNVNWFNQGTDPAGNVEFTLSLSDDTIWHPSPTDFILYTGTKTVSGGQTVNEPITFQVPGNVPPGDKYYILKINTGTPPVAESQANNVAVSSTRVNVRQADLVIKAVEFVDVLTGSPTQSALFGSMGRMRITASNEGGADARNFKVGVVISADASLSLLQDTIVIEQNVPLVAQGTTQVLDVTFQIPELDRAMHPFATGNYFWFGLLDSSGQVTELFETNNNMILMQPIVVRAPAPDLTVTRFDSPSSAGVGETVPVYRVFKNIGNRPASDVKYRYYASANSDVTVDDTLCRIVTGGTTREFDALSMAAGAVVAGTELIEIPGGLTPGTYYLGAVLDTDSSVTELDETNNGLASLPVAVAPSTLRITTTSLPDAVIGRPYMFQLSAAGEVPGQMSSWDVDMTQGNLPMGMTLSTSGLLSGAPMNEAVVGVTFRIQNNNVTAVKRLALRVLPTTTQVEITTPSLPSVVNSTLLMYETFLGAAGGVKPYRWSIVPVAGEVLPRNLQLTPEGRLYGNPASTVMEKAYPITVEVRDSLGTASRRQFNLRVVAPGAIIFTNLNLPDGLVGDAYLHDIAVRNFDMSPLAKPLTYRIVAGDLPDGITQVREGDVLLLQGTPHISGLFAFTIEVEDAKGRTDSADFLLRVYPSGLKVSVNNLPDALHAGDPIDFTFVVNGTTGVTFELYSGSLPPGATFNADGHVTGTVDAMTTIGSYNFVVQAKDSVGATGIGAFSVQVKREPPKKGCSCSAAEAGLIWAALLVVARRRRR